MNTLARTFKITATGNSKEELATDIDTSVNRNLFRDYQIRKGRSVPLFNTFIQRRSTLLNPQEQKDIQRYRKKGKINLYENL